MSKLNKNVRWGSILTIGILAILSLTFSSRFNKLVFSKVLNPYDPLKSKISQSKNTLLRNSKKVITKSWEDSRGLFPIIAFDTPENSKDLTASIRIVERGGINILVNGNLSWTPAPLQLKKAFQKLVASNMRWLPIITNECKDDYITNNANDASNSNIKKYLEEFNDKYVYGWYIWDEPGQNRKPCSPLNLVPNDDNADINRMIKQIRSDSNYSKKLSFVNLFPTYWEGTSDIESYGKYIDAFIASQEFKPRVLCFDHYPLLKEESGGFRKDYYANLDVVRKKSLEYNIQFWVIILSSEHLQYKKPTVEEISLQVYSSLAYGAKGLGYYLYSKSFSDYGYKSWILENYVDDETVADSLRGELFVPIKRLNEEVQTLGKILINLETIEVFHSSNYPNSQKDISHTIFKRNNTSSIVNTIVNNSEVYSDPRILIGVFKNKKGEPLSRKYLLIVNKDVNAEANIKIQLNKSHKVFKFTKETGDFNLITYDENFNSRIAPGSGELYILK